MACDVRVLKDVPLFALLDDEEAAVLAAQVETKDFAARERIFKIGDPSGPAYVVVSGKVRVFTVDEDQQEVVIDQPSRGDFFGFASMLEQTPHHTNAMAEEPSSCLEISRDDIATLLDRKPQAGMDLLNTLGRQFHASQELVRTRAQRNPSVPVYPLEPDSLHAGRHSSARNHDEPEPAGQKGPRARRA